MEAYAYVYLMKGRLGTYHGLTSVYKLSDGIDRERQTRTTRA